MSRTGVIRFYECEHQGDLNNYCDDLIASGAKVTQRTLDEDEEGLVKVEVEDYAAFMAKFKTTDAFQMSSLINS